MNTTRRITKLALATTGILTFFACNATEDLGEYEGPQTHETLVPVPSSPMKKVPPVAESPTFQTVGEFDSPTPQLVGGGNECPAVQLEYTVEDLRTNWRSANYNGEEVVTPCTDSACDDMQGQARLDFEVECDGQYRVWVLGLDEGYNDSFYVQVDDTPTEPTIFELGCEEDGDGLAWGALNSRQDEETPCSAEPWDPQLSAGTHRLHIWPRESRGISRIVVTNDLNWVPNY